MKPYLIFFLITLFTFAGPVIGQEEDPIVRAESDYRFQFDQYRQKYQAYQTQKANWLSSQTLKSQQEALVAAKEAAIARDEVVKSYTQWIRLQLIKLFPTYAKANEVSQQLQDQINWFSNHQQAIPLAANPAEFNAVMEQYSAEDTVQERGRLYAIAQIGLKLAQLAAYQHQTRNLYDPILLKLQDQLQIPEVSQGLAQVASLGDEINTAITEISDFTGSIKAKSFSATSVFRQINPRLVDTHTKQLTMLNLIVELESRYVQK